jgi:hypothetical protein
MNVAVVDGRAAFVAVALEGGGAAMVCRSCGASLRLDVGITDARRMQHDAGCVIGRAIAGTTKPVLLGERATRAN